MKYWRFYRILHRTYDIYHGPRESKNKQDWFLFYEDHNDIRRKFRKHCKKGFHACRHSYTTNLIGKLRNPIVTRQITGHRSTDVFDRYVHLYADLMEKSNITKKEGKRGLFIIEEGETA